jgi:type IV pilus assembly protein PilQ
MMLLFRVMLMAVLLISLAAKAAAQDAESSPNAAKNTRITVQSAKAEIVDVLRMVAVQGGLNLVIGPEVKGEVSAYLEDVDVHTALRAITINNGFEYTLEDGVITVSKPVQAIGDPAPPPVVTRVFSLRSQDANRVRDALEFALSAHGKMKVLNENSDLNYGVQNLSALSGNASGNNSGVGGVASGVSSGTQQPRGGLTSRFGDAGAAGQQTQAINARILVVTDLEEVVDRIAELIADLDKLPPQVLIEARIVEMSTDLQRRLGIDWNVSALASGPLIDHQWPLNNRAGFASGAQIMRDVSGNPKVSAGMALGTIDLTQFTALLRANQTDNSIRLLANPRLLVYNNHSASILVGERYPILQATITDFGTVTEAFSEYIPVGVQLEVTPTITLDGRVSMLVHPATSVLGDDVVGTTGLHVARIRTRELDTRVIMQDGQTVVLGGLISDRKTHQATKVPGLGDLPGLSMLFRQESPRSERVDLLVFLTAHVESATQIDERDQRVFDMYKPHFKHIERLQDVPLHFEIPTEYEPPRPMFSDPPVAADDEFRDAPESDTAPPAQKPAFDSFKRRDRIKAANAAVGCNVGTNLSAAPDSNAGYVIRIDGASTETAVGADSTSARPTQMELRDRRARLTPNSARTARPTDNRSRTGASHRVRRTRTIANSGGRIDDEP